MIEPPGNITQIPEYDGESAMDALSDVLRVARLSGGVFLHAEFTAPWCINAQANPALGFHFMNPTSHIIPYHYVAEGELVVRLADPNSEAIFLGPGEVVLFPHNQLHLMGSELSNSPIAVSDVIRPPKNGGLYSINYGGGGKPVRLVCGFLGIESAESNPVLLALPQVMVLNVAEGSGSEWVRSTFQFAANEVMEGRPGSETVLAKLSELLFIEAVRRYIETLPEGRTSWLAALRDPYVARALALFHGYVARPWTLNMLAQEIGLSRSAMAVRFANLVGMAPIQYLTHWRMQVASQELRNSSAPLTQIAAAVGYNSEAAFSRAFKNTFNTSPASWRRTAPRS
jgi:AraC family transcriptional regulator, alkane utilization regulator